VLLSTASWLKILPPCDSNVNSLNTAWNLLSETVNGPNLSMLLKTDQKLNRFTTFHRVTATKHQFLIGPRLTALYKSVLSNWVEESVTVVCMQACAVPHLSLLDDQVQSRLNQLVKYSSLMLLRHNALHQRSLTLTTHKQPAPSHQSHSYNHSATITHHFRRLPHRFFSPSVPKK